jgi:predicted DNA binding CopG/RHH family protein
VIAIRSATSERIKMKHQLDLTHGKIEQKIFIIRNKKIMVDRDLAFLYGVETKALNQEEFKNWKSQFVTSNSERMGLRKQPFAFTEHGILMLSSVLNSDKAIEVNIQIMRTFTKLRELMTTPKEVNLIDGNLFLRIDDEMVASLKKVAAKKGLGYLTLIRVWIAERLSKENRLQK